MSFEKIGTWINSFVEILGALATGKLTGAIMNLFHIKDINKTTAASVSADGSKAETEKIKPHFAGLGPEDNILRESILRLVDVDDDPAKNRQQNYREFEKWLKVKDISVWAALLSYLTTQAVFNSVDAQQTYEDIADVIINANAIGKNGNEEALIYVKSITEDVVFQLVRAYGKKFFEAMKVLTTKYPNLTLDELVRLLNRSLDHVDELLNWGESWVKMQQGYGFWRKFFCPWLLFKVPPNMLTLNHNYHTDGGGI